MAAGIKTPLNDVLMKISALTVTDGEGQPRALYARVWNNQLKYNEDGKLYDFPKPAAFVEILSPAVFEILGEGIRCSDINFRVHLIHESLNVEGSFEQDMVIFDLRDAVLQQLSDYAPTNCSPLECINESPEYDHNNLYHYMMDFLCNFTDTKASRLDSTHPNAYIPSVPPLSLELDITQAEGGASPTDSHAPVIKARRL